MVQHSQYFVKILGSIKQPYVRMILPDWATEFSLFVFLRFVNEDLLPKSMNVEDALRVLWISDYFQVGELINICIERYIRPQLSPDNVLTFIDDACAKLKLQETEDDIWYDLLDHCLDYVA